MLILQDGKEGREEEKHDAEMETECDERWTKGHQEKRLASNQCGACGSSCVFIRFFWRLGHRVCATKSFYLIRLRLEGFERERQGSRGSSRKESPSLIEQRICNWSYDPFQEHKEKKDVAQSRSPSAHWTSARTDPTQPNSHTPCSGTKTTNTQTQLASWLISKRSCGPSMVPDLILGIDIQKKGGTIIYRSEMDQWRLIATLKSIKKQMRSRWATTGRESCCAQKP